MIRGLQRFDSVTSALKPGRRTPQDYVGFRPRFRQNRRDRDGDCPPTEGVRRSGPSTAAPSGNAQSRSSGPFGRPNLRVSVPEPPTRSRPGIELPRKPLPNLPRPRSAATPAEAADPRPIRNAMELASAPAPPPFGRTGRSNRPERPPSRPMKVKKTRPHDWGRVLDIESVNRSANADRSTQAALRPSWTSDGGEPRRQPDRHPRAGPEPEPEQRRSRCSGCWPSRPSANPSRRSWNRRTTGS
jgi:hypothetical protein